MSEHTKGELEVGLNDNNDSVFSRSPHQNTAAANMNLVAICYGGNARANARRIKECWNAHAALTQQRDELLTACEFVAYNNDGKLCEDCPDCNTCEFGSAEECFQDKCNKAILKAKEQT